MLKDGVQVLERLPQPALRRLQPLVMQAYEAVTQGPLLLEYLQAVEHTATRAGLLAAGDPGRVATCCPPRTGWGSGEHGSNSAY
ncbi:MAG: hypothetical protein R3C68_14900 [Myxococcota bacterium]